MITTKVLPKPEDVIKNIKEDLKDTEWGELLRYFIDGPEMVKVVEELIELKKLGLSFIPQLKNAFRFLHLTPYSKIKMMMLLDASSKDGIPLSRPETPMPSTTLYKIQMTIDPKYKVKGDLSHWCRQGVLMVPCALTMTIRGDQHYDIWREFVSYIINKVNEKHKDIPVVFMKQRAMSWWNLVESNNKKEMQLWPEVRTQELWEWSNKLIKSQGKQEIKW